MIRPTLRWERELWTGGAQTVVGVDEVGVGPLCGAVVAAAVVLPIDVRRARLTGVRDSKTVARPLTRETLAGRIRRVAVKVGVAAASPRDIERLNIRGATELAMQRALARVGAYDHALIDGLPMRHIDRQRHTFIVDGDAYCLSIACASLIAKVTRDRLMELLAVRYPHYGWERNRGYATPDHLSALRRLGPTPHHRMLWRPILQAGLFAELEEEREIANPSLPIELVAPVHETAAVLAL